MTTCCNLNTEERGRTAESRPFLEKSLAFLFNDAVSHRRNEKRKVGSCDVSAVAESSGRVSALTSCSTSSSLGMMESSSTLSLQDTREGGGGGEVR